MGGCVLLRYARSGEARIKAASWALAMLAAAGLAAPYGKLRHDIGQQAPVLGTPVGLGPRDPAVAISQKYFAPEISEGRAEPGSGPEPGRGRAGSPGRARGRARAAKTGQIL